MKRLNLSVPLTDCVAESRPFNLRFLLRKIGTKYSHSAGLLRRLQVLNSKHLPPHIAYHRCSINRSDFKAGLVAVGLECGGVWRNYK